MFRGLSLFAALFLGAALLSQPSLAEDPKDGIAAAELSDRYRVADGISEGRLTLYPIIDKNVKPLPEGDFDLLGAAMEAGTLTITEVDSSGTVANLSVVNTGAKPVLLMAGDVITGGKQDRIVTEDLVLDTTKQPVIIAVNCVESGRWNATSQHFAYGGKAEIDLKHTVELEKNQSATWSKVAELNRKKAKKFEDNGAVAAALAPSTGTYSASLGNAAVIAARDAIVRDLRPALDKQENVVGLVVAIGDNVIAGELFGHPALFEKSEADLLNAFALDAVSSDDDGKAPPTSAAAAFLAEVLSAPNIRVLELSNGTRVNFEDAGVEGALLRAKSANAGEEGQIIHLNSYAK
jgi:hypothetical protein